jgi:hypothetical protein
MPLVGWAAPDRVPREMAVNPRSLVALVAPVSQEVSAEQPK